MNAYEGQLLIPVLSKMVDVRSSVSSPKTLLGFLLATVAHVILALIWLPIKDNVKVKEEYLFQLKLSLL